MTADHPAKIYVEPTTRCNLRCPMCVKYAAGSCIPEVDMGIATFRCLAPELPYVRELILNGIGEPLLHPDLTEMVRLARSLMPADGIIGFQSNGFLLDRRTAISLLTAGLDTVCLSLDQLDRVPPRIASDGGHAFAAVAQAVLALREARRAVGRPFRIGLETVLTRHNAGELPAIVGWAAASGVDYLLTTHLFQYGDSAAGDSLFNPNSAEAIDIFARYGAEASSRGLRLDRYPAAFMKFSKTTGDCDLLRLAEAMQAEARAKDVHLHLKSLAEWPAQGRDGLAELFATARRIADAGGIELHLPPLQAARERTCPFMGAGAVFVAADGDVMPCQFLWHSYSCRVNGEVIPVAARAFGNLARQPLAEIWQSPPYVQFRQEAIQAEYASCWECSQGPCPSLVNDSLYANDCYGSRVPCGHCQWSLGAIRCL